MNMEIICIILLMITSYVHAEVTCTNDANCLYSYATTLSVDCSSRDLKIPPCFNKTSDIVAINLRNNKFNHVPDNMPRNIEFLDLSHNNISDNTSLQKYKRLRHLNLDSNNIKADSFQNVTRMSNLQFLSLKGNFIDFDGYPNNLLAGFVSLYHLRIDGLPQGNFADMFPNKAYSLKILDVSGFDGSCSISRLNGSMFDKFNLTHLNLSHCNLMHIEKGSLASQRHLQFLDASYNERLGFRGFQSIAHDLMNSTIKVLKLKKVHCTFGLGTILLLNHTAYLNKTLLEELYLDSNRLEIIETGVITYHLPKSLRFLSLGDNKLDNGIYVLEVSALQNLQTLNVSFQIFSHNNYFEGCYDYHQSCHISPESKMNTNEGEIGEYPRYFNSVSSGFSLKPPKFTFYFPKNLTTILANNMKLQFSVGELFFGQCNITHIHFQNNFIYEMNGPTSGCNKLMYIDFSNNYCRNFTPHMLKIQTQLKVLNFSRNDLGHIFQNDNKGEMLGSNLKLAVLSLHDNKITTLPRNVFINNSMIKILNISHNRLDTWNVDLRHMHQLQLLDLSYNLISELNESRFDLLPKHTQFNISFLGNPLSCVCKNLFFFNWIHNNDLSRFIRLSETKCVYNNGSSLPLRNLPEILDILRKDCSSYSVIIILASSFICITTSFIVYRIIYRYRWKILYLYYLIKRVIFPENKKTIRKKFYESDVFISYADKQRGFVVNMAKELENKGFKVRIHDRDFIPGVDIAENITIAIHNSRRIILIMTSDFLKSQWCMFELNMARMESLYSREGVNCLLLILLEKSVVKEMPRSLLDIIECKSYLEYPDDNDDNDSLQSLSVFWRNLEDAVSDTEHNQEIVNDG
nr:toll-like receptor 4 isoform X2 [Crassostrea gigas]XP_034301998.1 toll-like receptor 4 isoform X2 [Crassostrea gigas]XP_034301999.1 toll-like receptor 4 isoform X2 [Crassostrea gigas]